MQGLQPMSAYIPFLVIGVTVGTVYGLSAMGLVLTYKTTGVFNFGHGAIGAGAAVVFYQLRQRDHFPTPVAAALAIVVFGVIVGTLIEAVARRLAEVSTTSKIVTTVGLIVGVQALVTLIYGQAALTFLPVLSQRRALTLSGVQITYEDVIVTVFGVVSAVTLFLFFQRTRTGRSMRAVVDDPALLDMSGVSPTRVRRAAWIIGCCFAALSGVLLASTQQQLDVTLLSLLVVQALGAAAIGAFTNLPLSFAGGILVGIVQALVSKEAGAHSVLQGLDTNTPFIVLFVVLLVIPRVKLVELGQRIKPPSTARAPVSRNVRTSVTAITIVGAALVPYVVGVHLATWSVAMSEVVLFLSLGLLVRTSGQISLCQIGFLAIGAAVSGHLVGAHVPWLLAVLLAGAVAIPVGALIAIPAIRLSGLFLALATLGFGVLLADYFYGKTYFFGSRVGLHTARPSLLHTDREYYFVLLGFALVAVALVTLIERARLGRLLRGLADSPLALSTLGVSANVTLVLVFCLSAFMAAVSGAIGASIFGGITQDSYSYVTSLVILAVLAFSGRSTVVAAIVAPLISVVLPAYIHSPDAPTWLQLGFGVAAIATGMLGEGQLAAVVRRRVDGFAALAHASAPSRLARRTSADLGLSIVKSRSEEVSPHAAV